MKNYKEQYGPWALVTGASSGIGEAFARRLASEGMNVALSARREETLRKLAEELTAAHGVECRVLPGDLTDEGEVARLAEATSDLDLGMLVNNAGFGQGVPFTELNEETGAKMIRLNCEAPYRLTRRLVPGMIERGRGAVIVVGSVVGCQATPYYNVYSATKGFANLFAESLWAELKPKGIDVLDVAPGGTKTEFQGRAGVSTASFYREPEDVVNTALKALGKKPRVVDGLTNKATVFFGRKIPYTWIVRMAGRVVRKMEGFA
jgi:hypothetical protein